MTEPRIVADRIAATLADAEAVLLVGSVAAGTHHDQSDIDLIVIGDDDCTLLVDDGWLVSLSWRSVDEVRATFVDPGTALLAVPAWRGAAILTDPNGLAAAVIDPALGDRRRRVVERALDATGAARLPGNLGRG